MFRACRIWGRDKDILENILPMFIFYLTGSTIIVLNFTLCLRTRYIAPLVAQSQVEAVQGHLKFALELDDVHIILQGQPGP